MDFQSLILIQLGFLNKSQRLIGYQAEVFIIEDRLSRPVAGPIQVCFDVILKIFFFIRRHGLNLASDIYLAGHYFGDEGLTVFFEEFNFSLFCGYQFVNLFGLAVKEVGDLGLF